MFCFLSLSSVRTLELLYVFIFRKNIVKVKKIPFFCTTFVDCVNKQHRERGEARKKTTKPHESQQRKKKLRLINFYCWKPERTVYSFLRAFSLEASAHRRRDFVIVGKRKPRFECSSLIQYRWPSRNHALHFEQRMLIMLIQRWIYLRDIDIPIISYYIWSSMNLLLLLFSNQSRVTYDDDDTLL